MHDDHVLPGQRWRPFLAASLLCFALSAMAMPRWQKRVIIGRVVPTATDDALVFAPGIGFACRIIDETKPLAEQSKDDPCAEIRVRAYLKVGDTLLPGPTMTGTLKEGVRARWEEWGAAAASWGPLADKLLPDANGNVKLGVYTTPMEGGCLPKVAVEKPAVDKAGEACLSIHGTLDVPLRKVGGLAMESALVQLETEGKDGAPFQTCVTTLDGCTETRALLAFVGCDGAAPDPACTPILKRIEAAERARVGVIVDVMAAGVDGVSGHREWSKLTRMLRDTPERVDARLAPRVRPLVATAAVAAFDAAMEKGALDVADDSLMTAEAATGKTAQAARRQRLATKQAAARAEAAARASRERSCVAGCMQAVVACDDNPGICGGSCNGTSLCPCCHPSKYDCTDGAIRIGYNMSHPGCK